MRRGAPSSIAASSFGHEMLLMPPTIMFRCSKPLPRSSAARSSPFPCSPERGREPPARRSIARTWDCHRHPSAFSSTPSAPGSPQTPQSVTSFFHKVLPRDHGLTHFVISVAVNVQHRDVHLRQGDHSLGARQDKGEPDVRLKVLEQPQCEDVPLRFHYSDFAVRDGVAIVVDGLQDHVQRVAIVPQSLRESDLSRPRHPVRSGRGHEVVIHDEVHCGGLIQVVVLLTVTA